MIQIKTTVEITMPDGLVLSESVTVAKGNHLLRREFLLGFYLSHDLPRRLFGGIWELVRLNRKRSKK
jgi:hypothetical protein